MTPHAVTPQGKASSTTLILQACPTQTHEKVDSECLRVW